VNDRKTDLDRATQETTAAEDRAGALRPVSNFLAMKEQREQSVRQLATARFDWERLAREVAHVMPADTFIASISAAATPGAAPDGSAVAASPGASVPTGPSMELLGCAKRQSSVATTMVRLRKLYRASDVTLGESVKGDASGTNARDCADYAFKLKVAFSQADAPAPKSRRVPASLGGGS
jgi:Tfp pilus assembly protein PilN